MSRRTVYRSFVFLTWVMQHIVVDFRVEHRERLKDLHSKVIIANHPSLLDVVMLVSIIPNADCIVKGSLVKNKFMSGIINSIYIPNCQSFDDQVKLSTESIHDGNCLIVFPEGTRTRPGEPWVFKKGAARFALAAECDVLPIYFGGNEKIGLRKFDKMFSFHPTSKYHYYLDVLEPISIKPFLEMPHGQATTMLNDEMKRVLLARRELDEEYTVSEKSHHML